MKLLTRMFIPGAIALMSIGAVQAESAPVDSNDIESQIAAARSQSDNQDSAPLAGMTVFIDEETGEFRAPTAEEAAELSAAMQRMLSPASRSASAETVSQRKLANGAVGARLGASQMVFTVATIGADGKITQSCAHGPEQAKEYLHNHVATAEEK